MGQLNNVALRVFKTDVVFIKPPPAKTAAALGDSKDASRKKLKPRTMLQLLVVTNILDLAMVVHLESQSSAPSNCQEFTQLTLFLLRDCKRYPEV